MKCNECQADKASAVESDGVWTCTDCQPFIAGPFSPWSQGTIDAPIAIGPFVAASYGLADPPMVIRDRGPYVLVDNPAPPPTPEPRLRPCPWCGGEAISGNGATYCNASDDCDMPGPDQDPQGERWNEVAGRLKRDRVAEVIRFLVARHRAEATRLREELSRERQARREAEERARSRI